MSQPSEPMRIMGTKSYPARLFSSNFRRIGSRQSNTKKKTANPLFQGTVLGSFGKLTFLAGGGTSSVYSSDSKIYGKNIAIKKIELEKSGDQSAPKARSRLFTFLGLNLATDQESKSTKQIKKEVSIWKDIDSASTPFLLNLVDHFFQGNECWIIMDLAEKGNLFHYTINFQNKHMIPLNFDIVRDIYAAVLLGLKHLHSKGIIHKDLKSENILLSANMTPMVADFGLAERISTDLTHDFGFQGTPFYAPPEAFFYSSYTETWDTFSFITSMMFTKFAKPCWEVFKGKTMENEDIGDIFMQLKDDPKQDDNLLVKMALKRPVLRFQEDSFGWTPEREEFTDFAAKCAKFDFSKRATATELTKVEEFGWRKACESWERNAEEMAAALEQKIDDWIEDDMYLEDKWLVF